MCEINEKTLKFDREVLNWVLDVCLRRFCGWVILESFTACSNIEMGDVLKCELVSVLLDDDAYLETSSNEGRNSDD